LSDIVVKCVTAVDKIERSLEALPHGDEVIQLMNFHHDSPGLRTLRHKVAESIVWLIENDPTAVAEMHKIHLANRRKARNV
jgi:hypothetical protein